MRAPPAKRKKNIHDEEPGTKNIITGDMSDDNIDSDIKMDEMNEISERKADEMMVS